MTINITIECDTISELHMHLSIIKSQIIKEAKKAKLDPFLHEFMNLSIGDKDNCYGSHEVKICTS